MSEFLLLLSVFLMSAGIALVFGFFYIESNFKKKLDFILSLIEEDRKKNWELKEFMQNLEERGKKNGLRGIFWYVSGDKLFVKGGEHLESPPITEEETVGNWKIVLKLFPEDPKGEHRSAWEAVAKLVMGVMKTKLLAETYAEEKSRRNLEALRNLIVHDAKNIAQFINNLAFNIENLESEAEKLEFLEHLKKALPSIKLRAMKVLATTEGKGFVELCEFVKNALKVYNLNCTVFCKRVFLHPELAIAVDNLLNNLRDRVQKYRAECQVSVEISGNNLLIKVKDTGPQPERFEKLFTPFYSTKNRGLGIGLYESLKLVESRGGSLKFDGEEKSFVITLPKSSELGNNVVNWHENSGSDCSEENTEE